MAINDDGDIIRGCGYMAIYFGYLEEEVGELFDLSIQFAPSLSEKINFGFTQKVKHLRRALIAKFTDEWPSNRDKDRISAILEECVHLADKRNSILHSSLYGGPIGEAILRNRRDGERVLNSSEIYELANKISDYVSHVYSLQFVVRRMPV
jgi:hypothetical protein